MNEIKSKVISIVSAHLAIEKEKISETSSFANDLGADSLDEVELIMAFEEHFNVVISDEISEKISTVGDMISFLEKNTL